MCVNENRVHVLPGSGAHEIPIYTGRPRDTLITFAIYVQELACPLQVPLSDFYFTERQKNCGTFVAAFGGGVTSHPYATMQIGSLKALTYLHVNNKHR